MYFPGEDEEPEADTKVATETEPKPVKAKTTKAKAKSPPAEKSKPKAKADKPEPKAKAKDPNNPYREGSASWIVSQVFTILAKKGTVHFDKLVAETVDIAKKRKVSMSDPSAKVRIIMGELLASKKAKRGSEKGTYVSA